MKNATAILMICAVGAGPSAVIAQSYKCAVDGKIVYQQARCDGGEKVNTTGAGVADPNSPASLQLRREINTIKRKELIDQLILEGRVEVGMSRDEVIRSWGSPTKVNKTINTSGTSEQWIYRRSGIGFDRYVYIDNGTVRSLQTSE